MHYIPVSKSVLSDLTDNSLYLELYSKDEQDLLLKLESLFKDWHSQFKEQEENGVIFKDHPADDMVFDGFYPGYLNQKIKILFIGWESLGISGCNNMEILYKAIKDQMIGGRTINQHSFHRRILYAVYALQKGITNYCDIPRPSEFTASFGCDDLSYAFMNVSKFSNDERSKADWQLINKSIELSIEDRNFIFEEIEILQPDLIIAMDVQRYWTVFKDISIIEDSLPIIHNIEAYKIILNSKPTLLIDANHFSQRSQKDETGYIKPIIECVERYKADFGLEF